MKSKGQLIARKMWGGRAGLFGTILSFLLLPVEGLWRLITGIRNRYADLRTGERIEGLPIVSVGNLAVGGTGKTPIASWVARELTELGARPAILQGRYGADEALLHAHWIPQMPVIVEGDRSKALTKALAAGADVGILDDGFQHRRVGRDVDLVVLATEDRFPAPVLPRGPYREPASALRRADAVIITRRTASVQEAFELGRRVRAQVSPTCTIASLRFETKTLTALGDSSETLCLPQVTKPYETMSFERPLESKGGWTPFLENIFVFTAVGRPETVIATVERLTTGSVEMCAFADHYHFTEADISSVREEAGSRPILVTEKDAVKLSNSAEQLAPCYIVEQEIVWDWGRDDVRTILREGTVA